MRVSFDPTKNERNIRNRGLSFEEAAKFDSQTANVYIDARQDNGETRYVALGGLNDRVDFL